MNSPDEPILVTEYNPSWPVLYAAERNRLRTACGDTVTRIEHVGSTAVPESAAAAIVDVLVGVRNLDAFAPHVTKLEAIGYVAFRGAFSPQRWLLRRRGPPHFNVAIAIDGSDYWRTQLHVREYLRAHPEEVRAYSDCKRSAFDNGSRTYLSFSQAKSSFVEGLMARAGRAVG
jgi:GrpB-like predicted nucleotidyltransferase (UPF0157 family)